MSCLDKAKKVAEVASRIGIPAHISQRAFGLGATATAALLTMSGLLLARRLNRQPQILSSAPATGDKPDQVVLPASEKQAPKIQKLLGQERYEPISETSLAGQRCAGCKIEAGTKSGAWYRLRGGVYCQDCAQGQAREIGASLVLPSIQTWGGQPASKQQTRGWGRKVLLKPTWVKVGLIKNIEGYEVLTARGEKTGLLLAPEVKAGNDGNVSVNKLRWFVHYELAGKAIGGPYESLNQAKGMASLMAGFDWNRPPEEFSEAEMKAVTRAANTYRADLEEEKLLKERAEAFSSPG